MTTNRIDVRGVAYVSHDSLTFGDYGGAGSVGQANIRVLREEYEGDTLEVWSSSLHNQYFHDEVWASDIEAERPSLLIENGSYGGETAWIREDISEDTIRALEDYPCLDDEKVSEVEQEWLEEALDDWLLRDVARELSEEDEERWGELTEEKQKELFYEAMEKANVYPVPEYSSVYVDVSRVVPHINLNG